MRFEIVQQNDTREKYFLGVKEEKFHIKGVIEWNDPNNSLIDFISIEVINKDPSGYMYEIKSGNLCLLNINGVLINVLEFHFVRNSSPPPSKSIIINTPQLEIKRGTYIFNSILIYNSSSEIKNCHYIDIGGQPDVKKGNILVGGA